MKVKSESKVTQSCPSLSYPMDCSLPGSSIHGIFQARVLEWGAIAFSGGHSIVSGFSVILLKPLIGVGKDKESGKEFQGFFRISAGRDGGYCVSAVPNKRRCVKEREKKNLCAVEARYGPVFLPEESHGQRSLAGYSPRGHKELDTTEAT